jgi:hypothetical protein
MSHPTKHYFFDRVLTIQDERERIIVLRDFNLVLPTVDIFDAPTRCYVVNEEWAKIIAGAVDLLTEIAVWKDAENEGYIGIRKIHEFLVGSDCMDCTGVENCLGTSAIITAMQAQIDSAIFTLGIHEGEIVGLDNRVSDIEAAIVILQSADIALQAQITSNDGDITNLQNADISLQAQITSNDGELAAHDITINQHSIAIAEHATRLNALEAGSGGAGSNSQSERHDYTHDYATETTISTPAGVWKKLVNLSHIVDVNPSNVVAVFEYLINIKVNTGQVAKFRVTDGTNIVNLGEKQSTVSGVWDTFLLHGFLIGVASGNQNLDLEFTTNDGATISFRGIAHHHITEIYNTPVEPLVTFDAGTYPYTLPSSNKGDVLSGGNPDDCLKGLALVGGQHISLKIDLGAEFPVHDIIYDARSSELNLNSTIIWVDGVVAGGNSYIGATPNTWEEFKQSDTSALLPLTGQVIIVQFNALASIPDMRLDNINIVLSD